MPFIEGPYPQDETSRAWSEPKSTIKQTVCKTEEESKLCMYSLFASSLIQCDFTLPLILSQRIIYKFSSGFWQCIRVIFLDKRYQFFTNKAAQVPGNAGVGGAHKGAQL